jgi:hypothetical protein
MEELYIEKFFSVKGEIGRNGFGLSGFNRGCWSSRDYLFIKWIVIIGEGFSKGGALGRLPRDTILEDDGLLGELAGLIW